MRPPDPGKDADTPTFVETLRGRAGRQGGEHAFHFAADGDAAPSGGVTYEGLDRKARALGARLAWGGLRGERAILLYPPGLEFIASFFGCLYGGTVAVPAHLPRPNRPTDRLRAIVDDARPRAILTTSALLPEAGRWAAEVPGLRGLAVIATDEVDPGLADGWRHPGVGPDALAFLQYTSGSTAMPKGVMVSHGNLIHGSAQIRRCFGSTGASRGVFWLPLYHDMGLIGGVLQTVYCGGSSTILPPVSFLQRPVRWLRAISETGATISGGPDFAYDLCARKVTPEQRAGLDLSRWEVAFDGAEPIRPETLDRFAEAFAPCGFRREAFLPCYGLAEATLLVSGLRSPGGPVVFAARAEALATGRVEPAEAPGEARPVVGSGGVPDGDEVAIVDPESRLPCPPDRVGEVWVRGPSVALGYWGRPEATEATFRAELPGAGGPFLRTGDLGFVRDGELFVAGRLKDLIIVRGRNIYPHDVERTAEEGHPSLRAGGSGAFSVEVDGQERLAVVAEVERPGQALKVDEVVAAVRRAVAESHEVDLHAVRLLKPGGLPRTSSGKVRRHACREGYLADDLDVVGGWTRDVGRSVPGDVPVADGEPAAPGRSAAEIAAWIAGQVARPLGIAPEDVDHAETFAGFGLGSMQAVTLAGELEQWLGRPLSPTLAYEYPTIAALARHLAGEADPVASGANPAASPDGAGAAIAIVGIGCRFPGGDGPEAFWRLLVDGGDAVGPVPEGRWPEYPAEPGRAGPRRGGFLGRVDRFDADFFGISPREAAAMDPQQRLLLEVAWEALEDAGLAPGRLAGTPVGVFVGIATDDYSRLGRGDHEGNDVYEITGNAASIAANRISFAFDFRGPSVAVDTACSSSLVAVEWACRSLRQGESAVALAAGVNLILSPEVSADFARAGFLAADGRCKTFSAEADGYVRGEGVGVVVLKPLARAVADGDPIYAVIRGGAINQDGRTNGLTAPSPQAQESVLRAAYRAAGVAPGRVGYVEAHGTGTRLGDPIEAMALGSVLAEGRPDGRDCLVGSVKTNIGHLEAAAGVAGLIKVALILHHRTIPASLHCDVLNPGIPFAALPLRVARETTGWPEADGPAVAGVSSFGFGGTNAHLVVEAAPGRPVGRAEAPAEAAGEESLLPLSARTPVALHALASSVRDGLRAVPEASVRDHAYTSAVRRDHHAHRLAIVAASAGAAAEAIDNHLAGVADARATAGRKPPGRRPGLVLVFSGQGGIWWGAGRDLLAREPAFRAVYEECDRLLAATGGRSLVRELADDRGAARLADPEFAQSHQFALQVALAALYRSWGIVPDAVVGHSLGEVAAAHVAGAIPLAEALRVVALRGRLMRTVLGLGKTAAVGLSEAEARRRIAGREDVLGVAAVNGPRTTTLSGEAGALGVLVESIRGGGSFARLLDVDCAFHGPQLDPLRSVMEEALAGLVPGPATVPFVSTVLGRVAAPSELVAAYWGRNLRDTVLFSAAIDAVAADAPGAFLEIGPHPIHRAAIAECLEGREAAPAILPSLRRGLPARGTLLGSLAALYAQGHPVDWDRLYPSGRLVSLPSYPWQGARHWIDGRVEPVDGNGRHPASVNGHSARNGNGRSHDLLTAPAAPGPAADEGRSEVDGLLSEIRWQAAEGTGPEDGRHLAGRWIIVSDAGEVGPALGAYLKEHGATFDLIGRAADDPLPPGVAGALDPDRGPCRGVIYLAALDHPATPVGDPTAAVETLCGDVLRLVGVMGGRVGMAPGRLWVVTRGAQPAGPDAGPLAVAQAPLWGLGRTIAQGHPGLWGGLIDLDPSGAADEPGALARLIGAEGPEDQVALRDGRALVPRLVPADVAGAVAAAPGLRPEGTYLITGGLGDLGLRVARRLVGRGARRLVLVGRRGLPDRDGWDDLAADDPARPAVEAVRALEHLGATVVAAAADVGDRAAMAGLFDRLARSLPPIRGIVHAAGVVQSRDAAEFDPEALAAVLRPKVAGAWALHELSRPLPLDFFVLFSSIASAWGSVKLADYAAANGFLDALAHHRGALGLPGLSINWGPWDGGGMVEGGGWGRSLGAMGLRPLGESEGLDALDRLMADPSARQASAASADWATLRALHGRSGRGRLLAGIAAGAGAPPKASRLRDLPAEGRRERLVGLLTDRVAQVLRLPPGEPEPDRPLDTLGVDSLIAMELRAGIEADLGVVVPLTAFLESTSVAQLADSMLAGLEDPEVPPESVLARAEAGVAERAPSFGQQSLWYAHQLSPTQGAYNIAGAARVRPGLDRDALRRAVRRLADRHEVLRTTYPESGGRPVLRVRDAIDDPLAVVDAAGWPEEQATADRAEAANRPFDLEAGPLIRVVVWSRPAPEGDDILIVLHHIVGDFWTIAVLVEELSRLYNAERSAEGSGAGLPALPLRYTDYARWQAEMLAGPEGGRLEGYWRSRLASPPPVLELPTDRPRPAVRTERGAVRHLELDATLSAEVLAFARGRSASLYTVLLAAFEVLLGRYSGQDDFAVGSAVAGRTRPGLDGLLGYFVNLIPMRADLAGNPTFDEALGRTRRVVHEGLEHQDYPFGLMVERLWREHATGQTPIFQAMFIYQKAQRLNQEGLSPYALGAGGHAIEVGGMHAESLAIERRASLFDMTLVAARGAGRLSLALEYSTDLFDESTADRFLASYRTLLAGIVADPGRRLADLPLLTDAERDRLVVDWAATPAEDAGADASCIHRLFEDRVVADPEAIAVVHGDRRMSYLELDVRADLMAHRLREACVGRGTTVGLCAGRSPELLVGLLAILKAGGCYLPLDPDYPAARLALMLADAKAAVILVDRGSRRAVAGRPEILVDLDADLDADDLFLDPVDPLPPSAGPDDPAYAIFTSGSTGVPKGVAVTHRSLVSAYRAWEHAYGLDSPPGPHLQAAGLSFDVFTGDWVRALGSGGTLVLCPRETLVEPEALHALMEGEGVEFAELVPAVAGRLVDWLERTGRRLDALRLLAVGSDSWRMASYRRLRRAIGAGARVVNSYGLTEATIDSTYFEGDLPGLDDDRPVPIGRPFAGTRAYVLDREMRPVPPGLPGDLYIGGAGVALGYLGRPGATAGRFLPDPFGEPGGRLYRTGDLALWRPDGLLELLGRADGQVKVRGVRIELGEVESALRRHPSVREAAVVARDEPAGGRSLVGFVVAEAGESAPPDAFALRRWLRGVLPEAMIPSAIHPLASLPLSANGKVDRKALAAIEAPALPREAYAPPTTPAEAEIARIAAEVLEVGRVGVHDNFLEMGLDSILIIQVASRARKAGLRLDPSLFFRHPTIASLAAAVGPVGRIDAPSGPPADDPAVAADRRALLDALDDPAGIEDAYPLTPVQEGMLFHTTAEPDAGMYVEQFTCRLRGPLVADAFAAAWRRVVARHPSLRTAIRWVESDRPVQAVYRSVDLPIDARDWSGLPEAEQEARLEGFLEADRRLGFVPSLPPMLRLALFRLGDDAHAMVWTSHHLVLDGWCLPILLGDVLASYEATVRGVVADLPAPRPFRDYVAWGRRQDLARSEAYWRRTLAGHVAPTPLGIGPGRPAPAPGTAPFGGRDAALDPSATAALRSFARSRGLTLATVVQGAWALVLARYAGRGDVVFGVTVSGRPAELEGVESMVGVFINTLPLRVAVDEEARLVPWLGEVQARLVALRAHEASPPVLVHEWSEVPRGRPLFDSIVTVQNTPGDLGLASGRGPIEIDRVRIDEQTNYPLTVTVVPGASLALRIGYDARRLDGDAVGRMAEHFRRLLERIAEGTDRRLADLSMVSGAEHDLLVGGWSGSHHGRRPGVVANGHPPSADDGLDASIAEIRRSLGETAR